MCVGYGFGGAPIGFAGLGVGGGCGVGGGFGNRYLYCRIESTEVCSITDKGL